MVRFADLPVIHDCKFDLCLLTFINFSNFPTVEVKLVSRDLHSKACGQFVKSTPLTYGYFTWYISAYKNFVDGDQGKADYLSFWLHYDPVPGYVASGTILAYYGRLQFEIVPASGMVEPIRFSSIEIFDERLNTNALERSRGWFDFALWEQVFNPANKFISPQKEIKLCVHVVIKEEIRKIPSFSRKFPLISSSPLPFADLFGREKDARRVVLYDRNDQSGVYKEFFLHDLPCLDKLLPCLEERMPDDLEVNQRNRIRKNIYWTVYTIKPEFHISAFMSIVRFFYRKELILIERLVEPVYKLAKTCDLIAIARACMYLGLELNNAFQLMPTVLRFHDEDDVPYFTNFIRLEHNITKLLDQPAFLQLTPECVKFIFDLNNLEGDEDSFAQALSCWSLAQIRKSRGELYQASPEQVRLYLKQHGLFELIRHSLLENPKSFLDDRDVEWLEYARLTPKSLKNKFNFNRYKIKRTNIASPYPKS